MESLTMDKIKERYKDYINFCLQHGLKVDQYTSLVLFLKETKSEKNLC